MADPTPLSNARPAAGAATPTPAAPSVRVMVVDDSAVIRGLLSRALEADPDIRVVASVGNGQMAVNTIARQPIAWWCSTSRCR